MDTDTNLNDPIICLNKGEQFQDCVSPNNNHCDGIKRTENSLEVSSNIDGNANPGKKKDPVTLSRIGVDADDHRLQRIDVLWKVQEGRPADTDASVSDCVLASELRTFDQNRARIVPHFQQQQAQKKNWANEEAAGSQINLDPNENQMNVVGKV